MTRVLKVACGSLAVSVVVLAMKAAAYWATGSVALYSDALESTINVVAGNQRRVSTLISIVSC